MGKTKTVSLGELSGFDKQVRLTHLLSLLAVIVGASYTILSLVLGFTFLAIFSLCVFLLFSFSHILNRYRQTRIARLVLILTADTFVFVMCSSLGREAGIRPLYFPLIAAIFIIYDIKEYRAIIILVLASVVIMVIGEVTNYTLFLIPDIKDSLSHIISAATFFAALGTSVLCTYYLVIINAGSESFLQRERGNTKSIIDNSKDLIVLVDTNYKIVTLNEPLRQSFKMVFGERDVVGEDINELLNSSERIPPQFKSWKKYYDKALTGQREIVDATSTGPDGSPRYLEMEFNPVYQGEQIVGAAAFVHDVTPRKLMEDRIRELNARQSAIINGANYSILTVGIDGYVSSFNLGSEKMFGYSSEEVIGKLGPHDLLSKKQLVKQAAVLSEETGRHVEPGVDIFRAMEETGQTDYEWEVATKDNHKQTISSSVTPLKDDKGGITAYLIISTDITEKKRAKEQLKKAADEEKLRIWISDGTAEVSLLLRIRDEEEQIYNRVIAYICNYTGALRADLFKVVEDHDTRPYLEISATYAGEPLRNKKVYRFGEGLVGQAARQQQIIAVDDVPADYLKIASSTGEASPGSVIIIPLIFEGELSGVLEMASFSGFDQRVRGFLENVSPVLAASMDQMKRRTRIEILLRESMELNEKLQTQEEELRVSNEELTEKSNLLQASEEEMRVQQEELMLVNSQMEEKARLLEEQNEAINQKNGELETAREVLKLKAEEMEVVSRYKSEFLANMSHELRTPLNSILILSKLLGESRENPLTSKQLEYASVIQKSGTDLLNLINDILDLSKIESRKIDLEIEEIPFSQVTYAMSSLFEEVAKEKGINYVVETAPGIGESYVGDRIRTEQILKNLLSNAFKFTPKEGTITFSIYEPRADEQFTNPYLLKSPRKICFSVSDSGIGISKEKQDLIFEAFRQADGSTSRKYGGTGLGLSISRELAMILGGELQLKSETGQGSTFTLILPGVFDAGSAADNDVKSVHAINGEDKPKEEKKTAEPQAAGDAAAAVSVLTRPERHKKLILIIEDDTSFARLLQDQAMEKGFDAVIASRGDEGLQKAEEMLPDAVLLDIGLPVMDGWTIMKKMKAKPETAAIPVHVLTGRDDADGHNNLGAIEILKKPVTPEQLKDVFDAIQRNGNAGTINALVIEDNEVYSSALQKTLTEAGIKVTMASTGAQALEALNAAIPDIVIIDLSLPDMKGNDIIKAIKKNKSARDAHIIVYTDQELSQKENNELMKSSDAIILKSASSQERLLDETTLFLKKLGRDKKIRGAAEITQNLFVEDQSLKGFTVLLADDDMRNIFALSNVLEQAELEVIIANDGKEALQKLNDNPEIALVLMDIMMPEMDGYEAIQKIREQDRYQKLPVIALTAKAMKGDREKCMEAGASDYISKPIDVNKLMSLIRVWLS